MAKWLFSLGGINIHVNEDSAFYVACSEGNLEIAQWLYYIVGDKKINIHAKQNQAFVKALSNGHLQVVQWLYTLGGFEKYAKSHSYKKSVQEGCISLAKWLYEVQHNLFDVKHFHK
jgi:hypothetical protein